MTKSPAPENARLKATNKEIFPPKRSMIIPAGMDMMPYAKKNENGKNAANVRLSPKLSIIIGSIGPNILVTKEMTNQIHKMRSTIQLFLFMIDRFND